MSTPRLPTYVRAQIESRERQQQTAFPAKVLSYSSSDGTVDVEPQFVETWITPKGERTSEETPDGTQIQNVPVCFPHFMSWKIDPGTFGLVICTKYSLDKWRTQLRRIDPGDLRRFTMSGATFHPVVIGKSPSVSQDFVALKAKVEAELDKIRDALTDSATGTQDGGSTYKTNITTALGTRASVGSSRVKAET